MNHTLHVEGQWGEYYEGNQERRSKNLRPHNWTRLNMTLKEMACIRKATMIARRYFGDLTKETSPFDLTYGLVWIEYGYFPIELNSIFEEIFDNYHKMKGIVALRVERWLNNDGLKRVQLEGHVAAYPASPVFIKEYFERVDIVGKHNDVFVKYDGYRKMILGVC